MFKISAGVKAFLIDLDGTLYFREEPVPGAAGSIEELRRRGYSLRFLTNTDSIPESDIIERMRQYGIMAEKCEIFSPVTAVRQFFIKNTDLTCYCLVTGRVAQSLTDLNFCDKNPDYVVIGDFADRVSYAEIDRAFRMIHAGAKIICTSKGRAYCRKDGAHIDTGAFVAMFEYAADVESKLLGKPDADFFRLALDSLGISGSEAAVVGDDISTDIVGAKAAGALSILVKTGKYSEAAAEKAGIVPDYIIDSIASLKDILI